MNIAYFADLELVAADIDPTSRGRVRDMRWPGVFNLQLFLPDSGPLRFRRDREAEQVFTEPTFYWHDPHHRYSFGPEADDGCWHHCWISLRGARAERLIRTGFAALAPAGWCPARPAGLAADRFAQVIAAGSGPGDRGTLAIILDQLLHQAIEASQTASPLHTGITALAERIAASPQLAIDANSEAAALGISAGHLRRAFRQQVGRSLHDYSLAQRMYQAARLLATSDRPITAIAAQLGYANLSQFGRLFRQRHGCSPRTFRTRLPR